MTQQPHINHIYTKQQQHKFIIIFGGTFDPVHLGHIALAHKLYDVFNQPIIILPTNNPPYKPATGSTVHQRLDMLKLAFNHDSRFIIDTREIFSSEYSCTYKTLKAIRKEVGFDIPIFFLIGSDSLITLDTWDNWLELFNLTNFIVAQRPDYNQNKVTNLTLLNEINTRTVHDVDNIIRHHNHGFDDTKCNVLDDAKYSILNYSTLNDADVRIKARISDKITSSISDNIPGNLSNNISDKINLPHDANLSKIQAYGRIYMLEFNPINVSSTMVRQTIAKCASTNNIDALEKLLNKLIPTIIKQYVVEHKLYYL